MKEKGYTASDEENAALTYTLVFAPDRKWVTVLTDGADARRKAAELAKGLKSYAVMIDLVDSDFAELSLFDEAGAHKDTLTLGNSYLEEAAPIGDPVAWQPLLCGSWEQVQEIQNGSYTFAEDALAHFAPLIGMDSGDVLLDNDSADDNAVVLHFKKTAEKKLTLNSAFVKVFGEGLLPLGFVKVKGKASFIKIINDEIVYTVTVGKDLVEDNAFNIFTTASTIYDSSISFQVSDFNYINFLTIYQCLITNADRFDIQRIDLNNLKYFKYDDSSIMNEMKKSYGLFFEYVIPVLNEAVDLETTLFTFDDSNKLRFPISYYLFLSNSNVYFDNKRIQLIKKLEQERKYGQEGFEDFQYSYQYYSYKLKDIENQINNYKTMVRERQADKQQYDEIMIKYEENKNRNLETLRNLGISETVPSLNTDTAPAKEKKLTLNSAFVKVFGEALEPLGFVRAGRKPVYVRLLDTGVLHIIACQKEKDADTFYRDPFRDKNAFCIYSTVSTLYDNDMMINNKVYATPSSIDNASVYTGLNPLNWDRKIRTGLMYSFYDDTDSSLMGKMNSVLEETQKYILKVLETVNTIEDCIVFSDKYDMAKRTDHWFLLSKDYNATLDLYYESAKAIITEEYLHGKSGKKPEDLPEYLKGFKEVVERKRCKFNELVSDKEKYDSFLKTVEENKKRNLDTLRNLGISETVPSLNSDTAPAKEKKLTLNSAFVKYFGELLTPHGFVKKSINKLPMFIRVINNEILQIVTYRQISSRKVGYSTFEIYSNIMTLYRDIPDLTTKPERYLHKMRFSKNGVMTLGEELVKRAIEYNVLLMQDKEIVWNDIPKDRYEWYLEDGLWRVGFHYAPDFHTGMVIARDIAEKILLPAFASTKTLEQCIDYFYSHDEEMRFYDYDEETRAFSDAESFNILPSYHTSEALTLIVADYRKDATQYTEKQLEQLVKDINGESGVKRGLEGAKNIEDYKARFRKRAQMETELRNLILDTPELKEKALTAAKEIQKKNMDMLRSYGVIE